MHIKIFLKFKRFTLVLIVAVLIVFVFFILLIEHYSSSAFKDVVTSLSLPFYNDTSSAVLNSAGTRALVTYNENDFMQRLLASSLLTAPDSNDVTNTQVSVYERDVNTIEILLSENISVLNAGEVELFFDPTQLVVTDLEINDSVCQSQFVITKVINNEVGRIFYQCGTLIPFDGVSTTLAVVSVLPQFIGTSTLRFGTHTHFLAHDGYGTNILNSLFGTTYSNPFIKTQEEGVIQNE